VLVPNSSLEIILGRAGVVTINNRMYTRNDGGVLLQTDDVDIIRIGYHSQMSAQDVARGLHSGNDNLYIIVSTAANGFLKCGMWCIPLYLRPT